MKGFAAEPGTLARVLVLSLAIGLLATNGCAVKSAPPKLELAASASAPVRALYDEGTAAFQAGDLKKAQERYQAALNHARGLKDEAGIGLSLVGIGRVHVSLKEYPQALGALSAALSYFRETKNLSAKGLTLYFLGLAHAGMENTQSAIEVFDRALAIGDTLLERASEQERLTILTVRGSVFFSQAVAHQKLGQFTEAVKSYRKAAKDDQTVGNQQMAARALYLAAYLTRSDLKAPQQAIELYSEALSLLQKLGMVTEAAWTVHGLGKAFEELGEYEKALANYRAFLQRLRSGDLKANPLLEPEIIAGMGYIYRWLGRYEEAIEHFYAAGVKYREAQDAEGEADPLIQLAEVFFWLADTNPTFSTRLHNCQFFEGKGSQGRVNTRVRVSKCL